MQTFPEIIEAFGGASKFARAIDIPVQTALSMKRRQRIDSRYWPGIVAASAAKNVPGVDMALLAKIASQLPPRPARKSGPRRAEKLQA